MGASGPGIRIGIAWKLAVLLVISTAAFFCLFGYFQLRLQQSQSEQLILLSADRIADLIHSGARHTMMRNDRDGLHHQINDVGAEPGIRRVRLYNEEGRIQYSTAADEVGAMVDKSAEACYACHSQEAPLARLKRTDRARIFRDSAGRRTLAVIRPIENRPECSNAACHAHPASRRILGVIDAQLGLEAVDAQIAGHQRRMVGSTLVAIILMSVLSVVFVWTVIHKPIRELARGIRDVARGNLEQRLPVRSRDEIGDLGAAFNKMAEELDQAHSELTDWARTLEERVRRKTEQLEQAHTSLVASEKMASLGKLAATVAHEVNNPLFGMLTYARLGLKEIQQQENLDPKRKAALSDYLSVIERESKRCGEIMKNLLAFARQTAPQRSMNSVNTMAERAVKLIRHQLELQEISLELELDASVPEISCDADKIQQVLLVLMVNATEAMAEGGSLRVASTFDADAETVTLIVQDTGSGIPPEVASQIFEPFFTTKENQHRTGLGLAIAKGIVDQHGGRIAVESTEGKGTTFRITLPVRQPEQQPETDGMVVAQPAVTGPQSRKSA